MARMRQEDDYFSERMMTDEEALRLYNSPSKVVDSVMREFDSLSDFDCDEELL